MIKLKYKTLIIGDLVVFYAKFRKNRNIRLTVDGSGEIRVTCPYLTTEDEIRSFVIEKEKWIRNVLKKISSTQKLNYNKNLTNLEKKYLLNKIAAYVGKYELLLNTKVNRVSIRKMRTLWGSCTWQERTIRFNSMLFYMSEQFIEYIVLHEMAHIFVHNHSKDFYDLIKRYMPNYKEIWKEHKKVSLS